ncbi:hypothetical protein EG68_03205 [Paragonimus skrjabini miyazakii]|uniref:Uncharacterized protein n=1 Tax=Paragonimus skrjabini miyazakii TaxID=59628 RepID=A0A8S9Z2P4_9TREM|nr:hypothetical protein EG68_03205 [Paragonimus skrjabini miyazakii]
MLELCRLTAQLSRLLLNPLLRSQVSPHCPRVGLQVLRTASGKQPACTLQVNQVILQSVQSVHKTTRLIALCSQF